jgi:hypothetical protein
VYLVHWGCFVPGTSGGGLYQVQNKENVPGTGEWFCTRYTGQPEPLDAWLDWGDLSLAQSGQSEPGSF